MNQQFPIAAVIDAIQRKAVYENQMQQQQRQDLLQGIQGASEGMQSVGDARRRMAAAMTMSKSPAVQNALGAGQVIPGTGSVNAPANQALTTGPSGQPVTPAMTAQGSPGAAPVPNTPSQVTPTLTPEQIQPLLGRQSQDYMGDIVKMNNLARMQQAFQAKGTVVTPIINQDGTISWGQTQVPPGATVQRPTRIPVPGNGRGGSGSGGSGGFSPNQRRIQQLQKSYDQLANQLKSAYGPDRERIAAQMDPIKAEIDQGLNVPAGAPAAQPGADSPPPEALSHLREGVTTKFKNGQTWTLQNGQPRRVQ